MWVFVRFEGALLETWFDELVFGIGVTSLWLYLYYLQDTGRSASDQFCVTHVAWVPGREDEGEGDMILEIRKERLFSVRKK
jgi:hypothetical protein